MSTYESLKYNFDGASLSGIEGVPTGTIISWSASTPSGYLDCDGSAVSRTTYADLFAVIGTTYGSGDGSTTFNVPNLEDNVPVGKSGTKALASTGGTNTVTPTGNVAGSTANATLSEAQLASHNHGIRPKTGSQSQIGISRVVNVYQLSTTQNDAITYTGSSSGHAHNMSANFAGDATSVVQPYLAVNFVIKT